jgi:hypothetical protein
MTLTIQESIDRDRIPQGLLCFLASTPASKIHAADCSNWVQGCDRPVSWDKCRRLLTALQSVQSLLAASSVRPDLDDYVGIKEAISRTQQRQEENKERSAIAAMHTARYLSLPETSQVLSDSSV